MRLTRHTALAALTLAALPALMVPATASAQDSAATTPVRTRTHTVRRGDTLWDLSRSYMGDPFLWPELYRLNTTVVEDPHWIYPGERLTLPDAVAVAAEPEPEPEAPAPPVFAAAIRPRRTVASERLEPLGQGRFAAVRPGEIDAAPFVDREGGPAGAGRIIQTAALSSIRSNLDEQALLLNDELYVTLPKGSTPEIGARYLVYTLGKRLDKVGQLIVPTGIVRIESAASGTTPRARLTRQFGRVVAGQAMIALDSELPPADAAPAPVDAAAVSATVVWIPDEPVLASVQRYVVLDASARKGTRVGDRFTLVRPRQAHEGTLPFPEEEIAVAQVVRVTPYAATAIVVSQEHPAISRGTRARVSAKMP
jgi:nucleoid-associated protein YgaU